MLTRQGLFKVQAFVFGPVGGMLRGAPFDAAVAEKAGAARAGHGGHDPGRVRQRHAYLHGTIKTKAREGIWTNKSDFDSKANDLVKAAADLEAAAKTGDKDATIEGGRAGSARPAAPATTSSATIRNARLPAAAPSAEGCGRQTQSTTQ